MMHHADADPLSVQRNIVLALLLALAAVAWAVLVWQARSGDADMAMASPTMGMQAPLFLAIWVVMMVAMMFPTAAPMILTFHRIQAGKRERGDTFVATWIFIAAYMVIWTLAGVAAYLAALGAEALATWASLSPTDTARIGGGILIAAGIYQVEPLKDLCLSKCRTPLTFILTSWRGGVVGAMRMGFLHGVYCLGCCWFLFVLLFPLGMMNIAAMASITLLIFAEKTLPWGRAAARIAAGALIAYGVLVLAEPQALPTFAPGTMAMPNPAGPMLMR
jgi:predicted metal-binding membrane protein